MHRCVVQTRRTRVGRAFVFLALVLHACGGKSVKHDDDGSTGGTDETGAAAGTGAYPGGGMPSGGGGVGGSSGGGGGVIDCDDCPSIACAPGTHAETQPGDCCPSCVPDAQDPCTQGQERYAQLREELLAEDRAVGCATSADCALVIEENDCVYTCNTPVTRARAADFVTTLNATALDACVTCKAPEQNDCVSQIPFCLVGGCVGIDARSTGDP